ncbi:hypothetical protein [Streptomyces sp. CBMA156]|uniref:hypothetical protein n=1 Tax=Streptomyces sp. CBMA156 TaxID=1930280 RepID=UPI001661E8EB|nr:hypothetical protein [Streptomyces sp. CBMA156]MBD0671380.1 hypothetical protein [Streptomyces sp. CBMA156]
MPLTCGSGGIAVGRGGARRHWPRQAHFGSDHLTGLLARFPELLADELQIEFCEVVVAFAR